MNTIITDHPAAGEIYSLLNMFAGIWKTSGTIYNNPFVPEGRISGTDEYKWLAGGFFLIHYVDVKMGDLESKSIEIIGYDHASNTYLMNSFDNQGNHTIMHAEHKSGIWRFTGGAMRFTGTFSDNLKQHSGVWEYHENSTWNKWMDITLTKEE